MENYNPKFNRFKDAPWFPDEDIHCLIGGAGGISSWLTLFLARAGFKPMVFDFDIIEAQNVGGQLYTENQVGKPKVEALRQVVKDFASEDITVFNEKYTDKSVAHNIMFSGFDNMKARNDMFGVWKDYVQNVNTGDPKSIFIDGRLLAEQLQIFCVVASNPVHIEEYEKNLFDDSEVEDGPCTFKQTSHAAAMIASMMTGFFTNHITNVRNGDSARIVPLYTEYYIPLNMLT